MTAKKTNCNRALLCVPGMTRCLATIFLMFVTLVAFSPGVFGQSQGRASKIVTGVIHDEGGAPLPNASVTVKGTNRGTTTDADGQFTITVSSGETLVFSSVGMVTMEQKVGRAGRLVLTLTRQDKNLAEVVVVGYGQAKSVGTIVGSVDNVQPKVFAERPVSDVFDGLQGRVPGLQVLSSSGEPSSQASITLNGIGSLTQDATPLIVLDGIQVPIATINTLSPEDIASITVLKDASSTSIYGARAGNGVIYITTKKGVPGEDKVVVRTQYGFTNNADESFFKTFMSSSQLLNFEVAQGYFTAAQAAQTAQQYPYNTYWYNYYYVRNSPTTTNSVALSGGTSKTTYYVSASFANSNGITFGSAYQKYTFLTDLTTKVTPWLTAGIILSSGYNVSQQNPGGANQLLRGLYWLTPPYYTPVNPATGKNYDFIPGWNQYSAQYYIGQHPNPTEDVQVDPIGYLDFHPIKGLTVKTQAGMDAYDLTENSLRLPSDSQSLNDGAVAEYYTREVKETITNTAEYTFNVHSNNTFDILAGQEYIDDKYRTFNASSSGQSDNRLDQLNNGTTGFAANSLTTEFDYISYFGRADYNWQQKYYVNASVRQDESSLFGANNRDAVFGSFGVMWDAKKEAFLQKVDWLNTLNIRASVGTTGNSSITGTPATNDYQALALVGSNQYNGLGGYNLNSPGNPNLTWEKDKETTIGATFDVVKNTGHFDVLLYKRISASQLVSVPYPYTSGFASIESNVGSLENKGIDFKVGWDLVKTRKLLISPFVTAHYNIERVTALFQGLNYYEQNGTGVLWAIGKPQEYIEPIYAGVNPADGNPQWYEPNPDPKQIVNPYKNPKMLTENQNSDVTQQATGIKVNPPFDGGFGVDASFAGFQLSVAFSFAGGAAKINNDQFFSANPNIFESYNQSKMVVNYWKKPGDIAQFPSMANTEWSFFDTGLTQEADFVRMKVATLSYSLPHKLLEKTKAIKDVKIYATGRNLLTITKYPGPDPEDNTNVELGSYPNTKQIVGGLDITF